MNGSLSDDCDGWLVDSEEGQPCILPGIQDCSIHARSFSSEIYICKTSILKAYIAASKTLGCLEFQVTVLQKEKRQLDERKHVGHRRYLNEAFVISNELESTLSLIP